MWLKSPWLRVSEVGPGKGSEPGQWVRRCAAAAILHILFKTATFLLPLGDCSDLLSLDPTSTSLATGECAPVLNLRVVAGDGWIKSESQFYMRTILRMLPSFIVAVALGLVAQSASAHPMITLA